MTPRLRTLAAPLALALLAPLAGPSSAVETVNSAIERTLNDASSDVRVARDQHVSSKTRRALDIRSASVRQIDSRKARVSMTLAGRMPANATGTRHLNFTMIGARPQRDPNVTVRLTDPPRRRAKIAAVWADNSHYDCRATVVRSNRGRTFTVTLPYRCTWWKVERVVADAFVYRKGYFHAVAWDSRSIGASLVWDDDMAASTG